jgi:hypothetical protein
MKYLITDTFDLTIYAMYDSEKVALRSLQNAIDKGWKIQGRKVMPDRLARLSVISREEFEEADVMVETYNLLDPERNPVMIRKSQLGGPCDPATERYHSM